MLLQNLFKSNGTIVSLSKLNICLRISSGLNYTNVIQCLDLVEQCEKCWVY